MLWQTLGALLAALEALLGDPGPATGPATGGEATLTYAQLRDRVADIAGRLAALGVEKGDRVVVYLPMIVDAVAVMVRVRGGVRAAATARAR